MKFIDVALKTEQLAANLKLDIEDPNTIAILTNFVVDLEKAIDENYFKPKVNMNPAQRDMLRGLANAVVELCDGV